VQNSLKSTSKYHVHCLKNEEMGMNFQEGDDGPFWMSAEEKEKSKQDQPSGKIKKT
jgi:hypothetical protein